MINISRYDRRQFIKGSAGIAAIAAAGLGPLTPKAVAGTVYADTRFDFSDAMHTLSTGITLALPNERLQGAAFGSQNKLFTVQQPPGGGAAGALVVSYVKWNPTTDTISDWQSSYGKMTFTDFGHGQNFGVTFDGTDHWIWIECAARQNWDGSAYSGDGFGSQICRFKYKEGDTGTYSTSDIGYYSTALPQSYLYDQLQLCGPFDHTTRTAQSFSCCIDGISNRLCLRFNWLDANSSPKGTLGYTGATTGFQYAFYDINTLLAAGGHAALPSNPVFRGTGLPQISDGNGGTETSTPNQGFTFMENFVYMITGTGVPLHTCQYGADQGNVCITAFDSRAGQNPNCNFTHITGASGLNIREPEGLWIQRTGSDQRLMFCLTSAETCTSGPNGTTSPHKYANFYYKLNKTETLLTSCTIT